LSVLSSTQQKERYFTSNFGKWPTNESGEPQNKFTSNGGNFGPRKKVAAETLNFWQNKKQRVIFAFPPLSLSLLQFSSRHTKDINYHQAVRMH
jgi:hypothetical protein